jgi:hypothetical protein
MVEVMNKDKAAAAAVGERPPEAVTPPARRLACEFSRLTRTQALLLGV